MKWFVRLTVLAVLAALGVWLYGVFFPSPEKIIRKRLDSVATLASFTSGEGNLARLANVQQLLGFFSTTVEVSVDSPAHAQHTFTGRDEIQTALLGVRGALKGLKVKFLDPQIQVAADRQSAEVNLTAEAHLQGDRDFFVQELKIGFVLREGGWLIERIATVRTLK